MSINQDKQDILLGRARQCLQDAFQYVKTVAEMYDGKNEKLNQMYMLIGSVHNDVANFGKIEGESLADSSG